MKVKPVLLRTIAIATPLLLGATMRSATAQDDQAPPNDQGQPNRTLNNGGNNGFRRPGGPGAFMGGGGSGAAIAVAGQYVFVVQGSTLFQFNINDLGLVHRVRLEPLRSSGVGTQGGSDNSDRDNRGGQAPPSQQNDQ